MLLCIDRQKMTENLIMPKFHYADFHWNFPVANVVNTNCDKSICVADFHDLCLQQSHKLCCKVDIMEFGLKHIISSVHCVHLAKIITQQLSETSDKMCAHKPGLKNNSTICAGIRTEKKRKKSNWLLKSPFYFNTHICKTHFNWIHDHLTGFTWSEFT